MKKGKLIIFLALIVVVAMSTLCGCGSKSEGGNNADGSIGDSVIVGVNIDRKIVYEVSLSLSVDNIDDKIKSYTASCKTLNGYVYSQNQSSYDDYASANLVFKVPTEKLDEFVSSLGKSGKLESKSITTQDITAEYIDAEAELNSLNQQKTALQALLNDETISSSDKIEIITKIGEIDKEIQKITISIEKYDSLVNFSTVRVYIDEDFDDGFVGVALPIIFVNVIIVCLVVTVFVLYRKLNRERSNKKLN